MKIELEIIQRLKLRIFGKVFIGMKKMPHWAKGYLPFYVFRCPVHGLVVDYIHGFEDQLSCPKCVKK